MASSGGTLVTLDGRENPTRGGFMPPTRYPSYMDPRYVMAVSRADADEVLTLVAGVVQKVGGKSMRFGLGFVAALSNTAPVRLSPRSAPNEFPLIELAAGESVYLPLAQFGPLVCYEWYAVSSANAHLNVVSVELE